MKKPILAYFEYQEPFCSVQRTMLIYPNRKAEYSDTYYFYLSGKTYYTDFTSYKIKTKKVNLAKLGNLLHWEYLI